MKKSSGLNPVHEAIGFAARAHKGQLRKGIDLDYIVHPLEVLQLLTGRGYFQVDDILTNTLGALIGFLIFAIARRILRATGRKRDNE